MKILRDIDYNALISEKDNYVRTTSYWFNEYCKLLEKHKALLLKLKQLIEEEEKKQMRLSNIIEGNENKEQVREDLLRWKRKLQKQRDYCNEKIADINKVLAEDYHFADIASLYPDWMYMDTNSAFLDTDLLGER